MYWAEFDACRGGLNLLHEADDIVVFLLLQFCTYGQSLELNLLAFLSGTLHILLFISAYCANK